MPSTPMSKRIREGNDENCKNRPSGYCGKQHRKSTETYRDVLGVSPAGEEVIEDQKVRTAFFPIGDTEVGATGIYGC